MRIGFLLTLGFSEGKTKHLLREADLMRHLHHENILRLFDVQYERRGNTGGVKLFLITEYCGGGDMSKLPKPLPEETCRVYFRQIFAGLRYLRMKHIVHRDIKAANILLTSDGVVKVADFTFSMVKGDNEVMQTLCGTPLCLSAEVLLGN